MASRPVFVPLCEPERLVEERSFEFEWNPGFAPTQKQKNVVALHDAANRQGLSPLLEVSTKSEDLIGQRLSAFNLKIDTEIGEIPVEVAYQGSKVFEGGGPFTDLYSVDSRTAKKDPRLKESGDLIRFDYFGQVWPLEPKTAFYDWLYLSALEPHQEFLERLFKYSGFTDIEFNPSRSINCQARTCALLVSLLKLDSLSEALRSQERFIEVVASDALSQTHSAGLRQGSLRFDG